MEHNIITTISGIESLKEDWERIQIQDSGLTYFSTFEYCYSWFQVYHDQPQFEIFVVAVMHNNQIMGIAPLVLHRKQKWGLSYVSLEFHYAGDYRDFIIDQFSGANPMNIVKEIFSVIENNDHLWDEINLTHINQNSLVCWYMLKSRLNKNFKYLIEVPFINLKNFEDFQDFCKNNLPNNINRYRNKLKKEISYQLKVYNEIELSKLGHIHILEKNHLIETKGARRKSGYEDLNKFVFYNKVYSNPNSCICFCLVDKNDKIFSYIIGFKYNKKYFYVNSAYDPKYESYNPGRILLYEIFIYLFESEIIDIFDFGTGRYAWKFEWTNRFNLLYRLNHINKKSKRLKLLKRLKSLKNALK
jgi:hypothetical protein